MMVSRGMRRLAPIPGRRTTRAEFDRPRYFRNQFVFVPGPDSATSVGMKPPHMAALALALAALGPAASAVALDFAGYTWEVRSGGGGPGPNQWSADNAWVDAAGLHLKISNVAGQWACAEVTMTQVLGFGTYLFQLTGRPDLLDRNVVLGLFNYPTDDVGPDGTNEIDIEFAQWGNAQLDHLNWTVYPPALGPAPESAVFPIHLSGDASTHRFTWSGKRIKFVSQHGYRTGGTKNLIASWTYAPAQPKLHIPQTPIPVHMNLWLFKGRPPADAQPVEIVIRSFKFTPL